MILRFLILFPLLFTAVKGQDFIIADFNTTMGDFSVALDYVNAPLACANFIQLAGKGDDILETADGVPFVTEASHSNHLYRSTTDSDAQRLPLSVRFIEATETEPEQFGIFQSNTYLGGVNTFFSVGHYADVTGEDRIRLEFANFNPVRYRITLRYPRTWVDARDQRIKDAPMYRALPINRVVSGQRFYAGSMTRSLLELPGYYFQDENINSTPFSSPWILAMDTVANNRNGSRFFVTSAVDRSLNGRFTAFGTVLQNAGRAVVQDIANTQTDEDQLPSTEMFILGITFRRSGLTAQAFFEGFHQSFIPGNVTEVGVGIERSGSQFSLVTPLQPGSLISLYSSTDLINYEGGAIVGQSPAQQTALTTDLTNTVAFLPKLFVRGFGANVPVWPSAEVDFADAEFRLSPNSEGDTGFVTLTFSERVVDDVVEVIGNYTINMQITQTQDDESFVTRSLGTGTFSATYDSSVGPYEGTLDFTNITGPLNVDQVTLHFEASAVRRFDARTTDPEATFLNYSGTYQ